MALSKLSTARLPTREALPTIDSGLP